MPGAVPPGGQPIAGARSTPGPGSSSAIGEGLPDVTTMVPMTAVVTGQGAPLTPRGLIWAFHVALPLVGLWLLLARPELDVEWEDHTAHFWLVLATAALNVGLALVVGEAAHRRSDARLYLVSLTFLCAAGFLGLHAIATPSVILDGANAGFVIATPIGVFLAGLFALASAVEWSPPHAATILRLRPLLTGGIFVVLATWLTLSLGGAAFLDRPVPIEELRGPLEALAVAGGIAYAIAAIGYYGLYRRRPSVVSLGVMTAFVLLAESMVAMAEARAWQASWWEWHVLLTLAFAYVAYSANVQYEREGTTTSLFRSISMEETVRRLRDEYAAALDELVTAIETAAETGATVRTRLVAAHLSDRFGLTEGQADILAEAAEALAVERREVRKLGLFRRYLSPEVATALLADPDRTDLGGSIREITVLFADLRGFTTFSERTDPAAVVTLLNTYFGGVVPVVLAAGGTVIQFIGDAIMAIFNAPMAQDDHALRAARAALGFQEVVDRLAVGHPDWPRFRVGIATGPALVGNVGSDEVRSYSAIGDTVNLAARLESWAEVGHVVISAATAERLAGLATLRPVGELELKGKTEPVEAYELVAVSSADAGPAPT
jgi:adenylate cyclase